MELVELTPSHHRAAQAAEAFIGADPVAVHAPLTFGPTVVVRLEFANGLDAYVKAGAEQDVHREAAVIARARAAGVPAPEVLGIGTDADLPGGRWLLTRAASGVRLNELGLESATIDRTLDDLVDLYARLHRVALPGFGPLHADASGGTLPSWSRWQRETIEKALAQLGEVPFDALGMCTAFAPDLDRAPGVLLHADLGDGETFVDPSTGAVTAVVDWGAALVGDPLYDLVRFVGGGPAEDERPGLVHPRLHARYLARIGLSPASAERMLTFYRFHICVVEAAWGEDIGWRPAHLAWAERLFDRLCG
ncbi:phosphotransferase family protein [Tenggerimyces flavus]|uniref:Phosphotransferase family protein n=1 Tax=Tenggerimyces flavus TaxID=1708749 RepID=A0ABV7YHB5_9ACTN|nr:phosphotransferase [Tenggerimyces flavus]MBM7784593.1 aminoglycoside phosphotransferase (APT) family kinase protein [Tenggerimyces flavus]